MKLYARRGFEWAEEGLVALWSPVSTGATQGMVIDCNPLTSNHGTLSGYTNLNLGWTGSQFGTALDFDGVNNCASASNMPSRSINDPISFSGWFWAPSGTYGTAKYFAAMPFTSGTNGVDFRDPSAVRFLTSNGTTFADVVSTIDIRNKWTFLSGTWDTRTTRLYADGVLVGSVAWASTVATGLRELSIGAFRPASFNTSVRCAEVYVHYRELSDKEILLAANAGPGTNAMWQDRPRRSRVYFSAAGFKAYWHRRETQIIGGGLK